MKDQEPAAQIADVIVIGAGAAGLMCAIEAAKRGRQVIVLDSSNKPGKKILMSGGGRCNFTNYHIGYEKYISHNLHFFKSALKRYTQWDFIQLVEQYGIAYHEKEDGQLFCNNSAKDILNMLLCECKKYSVNIFLKTQVKKIEKIDESFILETASHDYRCQSLVVATGGLSIPTMGSTPFGYQIAEQFGINVWPPRAGLVPFTLTPADKEKFSDLSGISVDSLVSCGQQQFRNNILFTHRGLSGPAILNISSYWKPNELVTIDLLPDINLIETLKSTQMTESKLLLKTFMTQYLPRRVIKAFIPDDLLQKNLQDISYRDFALISKNLKHWEVNPAGTEGYRTAEVTLGGVDCNAISSKTMMANDIPGLYFIGEVLDVTGWLGGYNFQWAWSSAVAAGKSA